jgi:hypothetical protein
MASEFFWTKRLEEESFASARESNFTHSVCSQTLYLLSYLSYKYTAILLEKNTKFLWLTTLRITVCGLLSSVGKYKNPAPNYFYSQNPKMQRKLYIKWATHTTLTLEGCQLSS